MQIHFSPGNQHATATSHAGLGLLKSVRPVQSYHWGTLRHCISITKEENPHDKAGGAPLLADLLGCSVGTCWPSLSSLSMCSRVVLPALSKPRNTSFPDFLYKPGRKTSKKHSSLMLFAYEPLSQGYAASCAHTGLPARAQNSREKNPYSLNWLLPGKPTVMSTTTDVS